MPELKNLEEKLANKELSTDELEKITGGLYNQSISSAASFVGTTLTGDIGLIDKPEIKDSEKPPIISGYMMPPINK